MIIQNIIQKKRDEITLEEEEINSFIKGITEGLLSDAQIAAMSMAIFLNGMNVEETVNLTKAMTRSGKIFK